MSYDTKSPVEGLAFAEKRVSDPDATLICIHGGLDRGASFSRLARRCEDYDVVAYDRRGYRGSRASGPVGFEQHVEDLLTIASEEARRGPVFFFGHSFGGTVAYAAAIADPTVVNLVTTYESPVPWVLRRESSRPPQTDDGAIEAERFFKHVVSESSWNRLSESEREMRRLDGAALLCDLATLWEPAPFDLRELVVPAVSIYGDGELSAHHRRLSPMLAALNPLVSARQLLGAGHGAHLSNPDHLSALLHELWDLQCALG